MDYSVVCDKDIQKKYDKLIKKMEHQYEEKLQIKLSDERKKTIDAVIKFKPELEKEKETLYELLVHCIDNKDDKEKKINNPIVLEEFEYNGNKYYKDDMGCVWNNKAEPVGSIGKYNTNEECILFNENTSNEDNIKFHDLED